MVFTPEYILAVETALHTVRERCENAIEGHLLLSLDKAASTADTLVFAATAQSWMANIGGALHGGMAALLTALSAKGRSEIYSPELILRGYDSPVEKLAKIGANIRFE